VKTLIKRTLALCSGRPNKLGNPKNLKIELWGAFLHFEQGRVPKL